MDVNDLRQAHDYTSLGVLFGVSAALLKNNLYKVSGYKHFTIPKKSGGVRSIYAPGRVRKRLQRCIVPILNQTYKLGPNVHGFAAGRSVRTNSIPHVAASVVVNFDLQDFFSTISFQRVRGVFLAHPMRLPWNVANILAQICTMDGVMPAGAITSPVLSNIICARLDKRLSALATRLGGSYTRYADDLTFSFDRPIGQLHGVVVVDEEGKPIVGGSISEIIASEGFSINMEKFRVSTRGSRKVVTGLVVNEKVNVRRPWYKSLESQVYAIEKFGLSEIAKAEFGEESGAGVAERRLLRRIHGKISYLNMIRGRGDWLVADIAHRFNKLHDSKELRVSNVELISQFSRLPRGAHIVNASDCHLDFFDLGYPQGTAFNTPSGLMITAAHVIEDTDRSALPYIYVMNERKMLLVRCELLAVDWDRDIAILRAQDKNLDVERSRYRIGQDPALGETLIAVGYPNYRENSHATVMEMQVTRTFQAGAIKKASVGGFIEGGMSGGPALNSRLEVCGIIHKGVTNQGGLSEVVSVSELIRVAIGAGLTL